jgi:hypothetical protein
MIIRGGLIYGGLALLGVIGVVSYLRKPKRNSEGFFGATGNGSPSSTDGLPDTFKRIPNPIKPTCFVYKKFPSPNGDYFYGKSPLTTNSLQMFFLITKNEFKSAYYNLPKCK